MVYISLLRGINVGGKNKIKMEQIKTLYQELGHTAVRSYIQSGNLVFESSSINTTHMAQEIKQGIKEHFDLDIESLVITHQELDTIYQDFPFKMEPLEQASSLAVIFLSEVPTADNVEILMSYVHTPEQFLAVGKHLYVYLPNGFSKTKLTNVFIEKKLKVVATTRNWKTVTKLQELSQT